MYGGRQGLHRGLLFALLMFTAQSGIPAEKNDVTAFEVVSALEETFGVHPGERRNHIKGTCAAGEFLGSTAARAFSRSPLFSGMRVPVVARFSVPGGNPKVPDTAKTPRGMALQFQLPKGERQHMTMLNTPVFGAASPKTFFDDIVSKKPDPATGRPDPEKIRAFRESHPDSLPQAKFLAKHNPSPSWANSSYFGIHAFRFVNRENKTTLVRWRFVPHDGEEWLSDEELVSSPPDFLERKLIERLRRGPVRWGMVLTIGVPGDPEDDPTQPWPTGREEVWAGTLTISSAAPQKGAECEKINYDPLVMADGIQPTNDPVLLFRSPSYAISFAKRISGQ